MKPALLAVLAAALLATSCTASLEPAAALVQLVTPTDGETLRGSVEVVLEVSDPGFTGPLELQIDGTREHAWGPLGRLRHALDTTRLADGVHEIAIVAREGRVEGELLRMGVVVDNEGPRLSFREPVSDVLFAEDGPFSIAVAASDTSGLSRVTLRAGARVLSDETSPGRELFIAEADPVALLGDAESVEVELEVVAIDAGGERTETTRTVTVRHRELWYATEEATTFGPAASPEGTVALATEDELVVYEADGTPRCRVAGAGTSASPLYLADGDAVLWATLTSLRIVTLADCTVAWSQATTAADFVSAATTAGGRVYAATFTGSLVSFRPDGSDLWTIDLGASLDPAPSSLEVTRALAVAPDGTIWIGGALSAARGILFAVEPGSRAVRSREMPSPLDAGIVATDEGAFAGGIDGRLYKVAPDMTRGWREEPLLSEGHPLECTPVALDDGNIVTCDGTGRVLALASDDGRVLWTYDASAGRVPFRLLGSAGISRAGSSGGLLAFGDRLGMLHVIDLGGQLRWRVQVTDAPAALVDPPATSGSRLYGVTEHGLLVGFEL